MSEAPESSTAAESAPTPSARRRVRTFPVYEGQRGLATSAQLRDTQWTTDALRHARGKTIHQVFPGVYAPHLGPLDAQDRLVAAYLWAGESAVLSGRVALDRHGVQVSSGGTCLFLVPNTRRSRRTAGVRTVRTTRPLGVSGFRDCVPLIGVARALCDAAVLQHLRGPELEAVTLSALQRRLTHPELVQEELSYQPGSAVDSIRSGLADFLAGAWSLPEASLARVVQDDPALPEFLLNVELRTPEGARIGCPDGYFRGAGVAVQVHSRAFHSGIDAEGRDRWTATVEKDGPFVDHGIVVVPVTPASVDKRPSQVLARLRRAVADNTGRDLSHIVVRERA